MCAGWHSCACGQHSATASPRTRPSRSGVTLWHQSYDLWILFSCTRGLPSACPRAFDLDSPSPGGLSPPHGAIPAAAAEWVCSSQGVRTPSPSPRRTPTLRRSRQPGHRRWPTRPRGHSSNSWQRPWRGRRRRRTCAELDSPAATEIPLLAVAGTDPRALSCLTRRLCRSMLGVCKLSRVGAVFDVVRRAV